MKSLILLAILPALARRTQPGRKPVTELQTKSPKTPWLWGEDSADSLDHTCAMVETFLINEPDNGPGWVVVHGSERYDIDIRVRLVKQ